MANGNIRLSVALAGKMRADMDYFWPQVETNDAPDGDASLQERESARTVVREDGPDLEIISNGQSVTRAV